MGRGWSHGSSPWPGIFLLREGSMENDKIIKGLELIKAVIQANTHVVCIQPYSTGMTPYNQTVLIEPSYVVGSIDKLMSKIKEDQLRGSRA